MDQFKSEMMQTFQGVAQRHLDVLCPTWVELFGLDCGSFCKTQLESHLESFFKQIVDENATKKKDFSQWIHGKLSFGNSNRQKTNKRIYLQVTQMKFASLKVAWVFRRHQMLPTAHCYHV